MESVQEQTDTRDYTKGVDVERKSSLLVLGRRTKKKMIWNWIRGAGLGSEDYGNTLATASLNPPWDVAWRIKLAPFSLRLCIFLVGNVVNYLMPLVEVDSVGELRLFLVFLVTQIGSCL